MNTSNWDNCYAMSEAYYYLMGGKDSGLTPIQGIWEGVSHWALRTKDGYIIDLTVDQFETIPDYSVFRGRGFMTKNPSKKAQEIIVETMECIKLLENQELFPDP